MPRYVRKRSHTAGHAPGLIVFGGEKRVDESRLTVFEYDASSATERELDRSEITQLKPSEDRVIWLNIDGVHDTDLIHSVGAHFGIHPLALEDIVSTLNRAKIDPYDQSLFAVARMLTYDSSRQHAASEQVSLFMRAGLVISFHELPGNVFQGLRDRIRTGAGRIRSCGAGYLCYALLDAIIDHYFVVLEQLGDEIELLEDAVLEDPSTATQLRIRTIRSNLTMIRRAIWPMREVLSFIARDEHPLFSNATQVYVRDAYDHAVQVMDIVESLRDLVGGLQDLAMTTISNRMNDVMKVLTIIGTIFIPLTFIAGVYGMNFVNMPELQMKYGYPVAIGAMVLIALVLIALFKKKKWL